MSLMAPESFAASCRGFFVYKFTANSYEYRSNENWKRNDLRMEEDFPCFQKSHLRPIEPMATTFAEIDSRQCQDSGFTQIVQLEFYHEQLTSTNLHLCKVESLSTWPCSKHWFPIPAKWHLDATFLQIQVLNLLSLVTVAATSWVQEDFKIRIRVKNGRIPLLQTQWRLPRWLDGLTVGTVEECAFDAALLHFAPRKWEFFPK